MINPEIPPTVVKNCFVIAPIGDPESETRKRSDLVLRFVIRPAVQACGYTAIRADEIDKPGMITSQVVQRVVGDPLVVADLTGRNPNVFYEVAIRHAVGRPLVQLIRKGEPIPFDIQGTRIIQFDDPDLENVGPTMNEIIGQVKALEREPARMETPISVALDLQTLYQSEKAGERSLADLVTAFSSLNQGFSRLEGMIRAGGSSLELAEVKHGMNELLRSLRLHKHGSFGLLSSANFRHGVLDDIICRSASAGSSGFAVLIIASAFRDSMPWVYEVGVDAYRKIRLGDEDAREAFDEFRRVLHFSARGPIGEIFRTREDAFWVLEEVEPLLDRIGVIVFPELLRDQTIR